MLRIPRAIWQQEIARSARAAEGSLNFMTRDHHRVRDFVVREMPRLGKPISPSLISKALKIEPEITNSILDELEEKLTFLFRNQGGSVTWAYPVTVTQTPHRITFSSGEQIYAA